MKLIRLQSGPLACVYPDEPAAEPSGGRVSGFYRAFSGSVEAVGASEGEALAALDRNVRSLSTRPSGHAHESVDLNDSAQPECEELHLTTTESRNRRDTDRCASPFDSRPALARAGAPDTVRVPRLSSLPPPALATAR